MKYKLDRNQRDTVENCNIAFRICFMNMLNDYECNSIPDDVAKKNFTKFFFCMMHSSFAEDEKFKYFRKLATLANMTCEIMQNEVSWETWDKIPALFDKWEEID